MDKRSDYPIYLLTSLGAPRDHHSLFVLTSPVSSSTNTSLDSSNTAKEGFVYQVSGNIQTGMYFNHKPVTDPEAQIDFISLKRLGSVSKDHFQDIGKELGSGKLKEIIESVEAPEKQFEGNKRINGGKVKLRRCQEWIEEVVEKLGKKGLLID